MTPLLHVKIPGEPIVLQRHRWGQGRNYDPTVDQKKTVRWQVKAACPNLKPATGRLSFILEVWSGKAPVKDRKNGGMKFQTDASNYLKFYEDALNGQVWNDDSQIDDARVIVHRSALEPRIELLVWELP